MFKPFETNVLARVDTLEKEVKKLPAQLNNIESSFEKSLNFNIGEIKKVDQRVDQVMEQNRMLNERIDNLVDILQFERAQRLKLNTRLIDLDDRQRRDNLVIDGIEDSDRETPKQCEERTRKYMKDKLKVDNADSIVIDRVHRLGKFKQNKNRPTIIKFNRYKQRVHVWGKRNKAPRGSRVRENFSKETEAARSKLFPIMMAARKLDYYAKLEGPRLIVSKRGGVHCVVTPDTVNDLPGELKPERLFTPTKDNATLFYTKHSPHSNFFPCKFHDSGKEFNCVEQYLVYRNALFDGNDRFAERILDMTDPAAIKSAGKEVSIDLDAQKEHMKKGMILKYTQNEDLQQLLRETGDNRLGEANPFDTYWGIGMRMHEDGAFDPSNWSDNWSGKLLEETREEVCT